MAVLAEFLVDGGKVGWSNVPSRWTDTFSQQVLF
jgi:hypothetical protein